MSLLSSMQEKARRARSADGLESLQWGSRNISHDRHRLRRPSVYEACSSLRNDSRRGGRPARAAERRRAERLRICAPRGVAQPGSALRSGRRGPQFKSGHPDRSRGGKHRFPPRVSLPGLGRPRPRCATLGERRHDYAAAVLCSVRAPRGRLRRRFHPRAARPRPRPGGLPRARAPLRARARAWRATRRRARPRSPRSSVTPSSTTRRRSGCSSPSGSSSAWAAGATPTAAAVEMEQRWAHSAHFELFDDALPALEFARAERAQGRAALELLARPRRVRRPPRARRRRGADLLRARQDEAARVDLPWRCSSCSRSRPAEAVMVGDTLHEDIEGALAVGMRAVLLDRDGRHPEVAGPARRPCASCRRRSGSNRLAPVRRANIFSPRVRPAVRARGLPLARRADRSRRRRRAGRRLRCTSSARASGASLPFPSRDGGVGDRASRERRPCATRAVSGRCAPATSSASRPGPRARTSCAGPGRC